VEKKTVLVVDDDYLLVRTIEMCLRKRGHEVRAFQNGVDAVKCLFEWKPDVIVLDIMLPDCDGWFLASLLNKLELAEKVPLIVVSALEPDRGRMAEARPYAYIQKPFDMGQLLQAVDRGLGVQEQLGERVYAAGA
jgi:DNA-binding response OmpR family regulator